MEPVVPCLNPRQAQDGPRALLYQSPHDAFKLVLEKTLESPSDSKEIKPVHPKGNQS